MKVKRTPRPDTYCRYRNCGKRLSPGRHGRRHYCNQACKQAEYRCRQADQIVTSANSERNEALEAEKL